MTSKNGKRSIKIGLFDSGVGGLSVLSQLAKLSSPDCHIEFVYVGDTARCPYGNRPGYEICGFLSEIIGWLVSQNVDRIVMACNTSAAAGFNFARSISPVPVHDLIGSAARYAAKNFERIGVVATASTANSGAFGKQIRSYNAKAEVVEVGCPKLVPLIESGSLTGQEIENAVAEYASEVQGVEALILGCTHYPLISNLFKKYLPEVVLLDPAESLLGHLSNELSVPYPLKTTEGNHKIWGKTQFAITGDPSLFIKALSICLSTDSIAVQAEQLPLEVLAQAALELPQSAMADLVSNVVPILSNSQPSSDAKAALP